MIWPGSHNSMSSSAYNFFGAEHTITVPEQLNAGARFLMLDAYYGYDDNGLIRTNLAGGVDRQALRKERGDNALHELNRLGAAHRCRRHIRARSRTCTSATTSASWARCRRRRSSATSATSSIATSPTSSSSTSRTTSSPGTSRRRWSTPTSSTAPGSRSRAPRACPSLYDMVVPKNKKATDNKQRLIVMSERHPDATPWMHGTYTLSEETPYTFSDIKDFNSARNRGGTGKDFFIMNHWLRPDGPPDPSEAAQVNSKKTLSARIDQCIVKRGRIPDVVAVDFTAIGDMYSTVNEYNSAIARPHRRHAHHQRGRARDPGEEHDHPGRPRELRALRRLPYVPSRRPASSSARCRTGCRHRRRSTSSSSRPARRAPRPRRRHHGRPLASRSPAEQECGR